MPTVDGPTHAYHLVPKLVSKAAAVAAHARARGYDPADCIAVGDSVEDLEVAAAVGRFFVVANGPERDPGLRAALGAWDNATVTEGAWATASTRRSSRPWSNAAERSTSIEPMDDSARPRPSPSRSTWRSCSGSRRPGCR